MRLADYVVRFLEECGIDHAFTVCGGGSIFLCDGLAKADRMRYVATHHEQAAAMAAEAYARVRTDLGLAVVTSGPGGTNAITGVAGAWTDHVPTLTLSGQVFSSQMITNRPGLRTCGVQEINIVDLVAPITKYARVVDRPEDIRLHLERALQTAVSGRPGPVWLDIPADVQKANVDPKALLGCADLGLDCPRVDAAKVRDVANLLKSASRPLLHVGQGVRLSGAIESMFEFLELSRIPVVTARNGNDLIDSGHAQYVGRPGTFAQRGANFAVQNCDLYLAVGTRLSLAQTGYSAQDYARRARVVMVDVDAAELAKGTVRVDVPIQADAGDFLEVLSRELRGERLPDWSAWLEQCKEWQAKYPPVTEEQRQDERYANSYALIDRLSEACDAEDVVVTDMGFAFQNTHQAWRVKEGQRVFTNCGLAAMGWGLPAAIGAHVGSDRRTICIAGDGGFMFTAHELATLMHHRFPIKVFLLNNGGYLTMRQSQANAFESYMGSDEGSGISFPHFGQFVRAHGIPHLLAEKSGELQPRIEAALRMGGPCVVEVLMDPDQPQIPKSINKRDEAGNIKQTPIEDAWPYLSREELEENMAVGE